MDVVGLQTVYVAERWVLAKQCFITERRSLEEKAQWARGI